MTSTDIPLLLESWQLAAMLNNDKLLLIDLSTADSYRQSHIPGAVHLDYSHLLRGIKPATGLLPAADQLQQVLSKIGLQPDLHVVAYDNERSGRASRLLWTLDVAGHQHMSLLNGGFSAWQSAGHQTEQGVNQPQSGAYSLIVDDKPLADKSYVLNSLDNPGIILLDARSDAEYHGIQSPAQRHGRIPGAVHLNWLDTIDQAHDLRFKPDQILQQMLTSRGITPDHQVITYCQTHHRSSHSYIMLKHLAFTDIKGYAGSWSEWGNDAELPLE